MFCHRNGLRLAWALRLLNDGLGETTCRLFTLYIYNSICILLITSKYISLNKMYSINNYIKLIDLYILFICKLFDRVKNDTSNPFILLSGIIKWKFDWKLYFSSNHLKYIIILVVLTKFRRQCLCCLLLIFFFFFPLKSIVF